MALATKASLIPLVDAVKTTIETMSSDPDVAHEKLLNQINTLVLAAESPLETIYRIGHQPWQIASVRVAIDLNIFTKLVQSGDHGMSIDSLAEDTSADSLLIARLLRILVAMGLCSCGRDGTYLPNPKTAILTEAQGTDSFRIWADICMPTATKLPEYFRTNGYQNPKEATNSPFAATFGEEFWAWISNKPEHASVFNSFMASRRKGRPSWFDVYPVEEGLFADAQQIDKDTALLIDVGGNRGHDLINFKSKYPNHPGKIILQDLPDVISTLSAGEMKGIELMPHNFFEPQPIKGARAYYFRAIFHDWPNARCQQILRHTKDAMTPGYSKLLIAEFILADHNSRLVPASLDIQMMGLHSGMERSAQQWRELLDSVGLKVTRIWQKLEGGEGVIEAMC